MPTQKKIHVHGDNIVECERTIALLRSSLTEVTIEFKGPSGSPVCPRYHIALSDPLVEIEIVTFPGFGRWNQDILGLVREMGGELREAPDAIICRTEDSECPLLAIEFCGALPAGNQAWQRSGRAYSLGQAGIPYLYVAELGGFELDSSRKRKAARLPNAAVPFSFLSFSVQSGHSILPVFIPSPGAHGESKKVFEDVYGHKVLPEIIKRAVLDLPILEQMADLERRAVEFIAIKARSARPGRSLTEAQWKEAARLMKEGTSLVKYLTDDVALKWKKVAYIRGLTASANSLMAIGASYGVGLTSSELPMCIIPAGKRAAFSKAVRLLYDNSLTASFQAWLERPGELAICWVMGFKPRGDDARPDRGLPPFARKLVGNGCDLLSVVYGPAPKATWSLLDQAPKKLTELNGLWQSLLGMSDAILVDSSTDDIKVRGYTKAHWTGAAAPKTVNAIKVEPKPVKLGENDVDTVLHLLLARHAGATIFEGMCNPPGGDWSGLSLLTVDSAIELRWISLPRVSASGGKRPDHVFQISIPHHKPLVLIVESKDTRSQVEEGIGPRLKTYVKVLTSSEASIERTGGTTDWDHSERSLDAEDYSFVSAVAFVMKSDAELKSSLEFAEVDLAIGVSFSPGGETCALKIVTSTGEGKIVAGQLQKIQAQNQPITIEIIDN